MDRYQRQRDVTGNEWWRRFSLRERGKQNLDRSLDRFIRRDFGDVDILFVPDDLATTDPSLLHEMKLGHFGLDGVFVELEAADACVFDAAFVDDSFNRALHGFSWLRDLSALDEDAAAGEAQRLVFEWLERHRKIAGVAYEPEVIARRVISFLSHAPLVNRNLDRKHQRAFIEAVSTQVAVLRSLAHHVPAGLPRLDALTALALAGLCLSHHTDLLAEATPLLETELERQILADGGHATRNTGVLLRLLFDLLPLTRLYRSRDGRVPEGIERALARMLPMVRFQRMGDTSLARFNGVSATPTDALATLFAHDERKREQAEAAPVSGYARIEEGPCIVFADVGAPPVGPDALDAHAGCLAFEMSVRHFALIVNAGAYRGEDETWRLYARSTSAHSTLTIDDRSQGGFSETGELVGPCEVGTMASGPRVIEAAHGGYAAAFGLRHRRRLQIENDGLRLRGHDVLDRAGRAGISAALAPDGLLGAVPIFRIRFHLHPFIELSQVDDANLLLSLPDGEVWRFHAEGARLETADSVYLAYRRGIEPAHQIVLSGDAVAGLEVKWLIEQFRPKPSAI